MDIALVFIGVVFVGVAIFWQAPHFHFGWAGVFLVAVGGVLLPALGIH